NLISHILKNNDWGETTPKIRGFRELIIEWAAYNPSGNNARPFWISKGNSAILNIPKSDDAYVGSKYNDILNELKSYTSEQSIERICNDLTSYVRTHENSSIPGIGKVFNDTRAY